MVDALAFPALYRRKQSDSGRLAGQEDARCAFHQTKQADEVCSDCGRLVCALCSIPAGSRTLCPSCMQRSSNEKAGGEFVKQRVAWDSLAIRLVAHPLLLAFWYVTPLTAIAALILSIVKFNKPMGPVPRTRWRFTVAIILSLIWIGGWIVAVTAITTQLLPMLGEAGKAG
jgi:hypothetical protein